MGEHTGSNGGDREDDGRTVNVEVPDSATPPEAAAIVAAVESYLAAERAAVEAATADDRTWDGRRWSFAGRLEDLTGRPARVPDGVPGDAWTATGRADRF